jgi:hypothetical protein
LATPRLLALPFYNAQQEMWCAPAPIGSNLNAGYSELYPKETIYGCIDALAAAGVTGGIINIAPNTHVGGEVPGQGIWLTHDGTLYPGWRKIPENGFTLRGYGSGPSNGQFSQPQAQVIRGNVGDVTKPSVRFDVGIWITTNAGRPVNVENLFWLGFSIGRRIAVNGNPAGNPDSPGQRASTETVAGVTWINCTWQNNGGSGDIGEGPVSDEGYFLFCDDINCNYNSYPDIAPTSHDRHASRLIKPGDGSSQLRMSKCKGSHSGVIYYAGASTWGLFIDGYTVESDFVHVLPSIVTTHGLVGSGFGYISGIEADDAVTASLAVDNSDGANSPTQLIVANTGLGTAGPMFIFGAADDGNGAVVTTPAGKYQQGLFAGKLWADMDNPRFAMPVISNRFYNMVPQRASLDGLSGAVTNPPDVGDSGNRKWTQAGATGAGTVNSPIADRHGGTTAVRIASTNGSGAYQRFFFRFQNAAVGDIWVAGAWVRMASQEFQPTLELILTNTGVTIENHHSDMFPGFGGDGQWQFLYGWGKVTATSGGSPQVLTSFYVQVDPGNPVDIDGRFLFKIPAGSVSQSELGNILQNMQSYVQAAPGIASSQPGQILCGLGGLAVGNSAAATTPGTVVNKMQVFDQFGASLGYVPIYNAIT